MPADNPSAQRRAKGKKIGQRHDSIATDVVDCRNFLEERLRHPYERPHSRVSMRAEPDRRILDRTRRENETPMSRLGRSVLHLSTGQIARSR